MDLGDLVGFALADSNAHQLATFEYVGPWRRLAPAEMPRGVPTTHSLDYINFRNREVKHSPSLAASSLKSYFCRPSHPLTANPAAIYGGKQSNSTPSFRISSRPSNLRIPRIAQQKAAFCNERSVASPSPLPSPSSPSLAR